MRFIAFSLVLAGTAAYAQYIPSTQQLGLLKGMNVHGGWFMGTGFKSGGKSIRLEGPTLGMDTNLGNIPLLGQTTLSASVIWAGATRKGDDNDATIWRLMSVTRGNISVSGWYPIGGFGYATSKARGTTSFDNRGSSITQFGIGKKLSKNAVNQVTGTDSAIELNYFLGRDPYRGFSLELSFKF